MSESKVPNPDERVTNTHNARLFTMAGIDDPKVTGKVLKLLEENLHAPSFRDFRRTVSEVLGDSHLRDAQLEFVFRNRVMKFFADETERQISDPIIDEVFPYAEILPIHDARTGVEHRAIEKMGLNGTGVYRRDDPVWQKFKPPWGLNCRCSSSILTVDRAASKGVIEARERLRTGKPPVQPTWVQMPQFDSKLTPCEILGVRGEVPYLLHKLRQEENWEWVFEVLGEIGPCAMAAVPALKDVLKCCEDEYVQIAAATALWRIENRADHVLSVILDLLKSTDTDVQSLTLETIRRFGLAGGDTLPAILRLICDEDSSLRADALSVATSIAPRSAEVLTALTESLRDRDGVVRFRAANALIKLGDSAKNSLPTFLQILHGDSKFGRDAVANLVVRIAPDSSQVVEALKAALSDPKSRVRIEVVKALAELGSAAKTAAPALVLLLQDRSKYVREAAASALAQIEACEESKGDDHV